MSITRVFRNPHAVGKWVLFLAIYAVLGSFHSHPARAADRNEPEAPTRHRLEFGVGVAGTRTRSKPEWVSTFSGALRVNASLETIRGLSVQGGYDFTNGKEPRAEWLNYGTHEQISTLQGSYSEGSWAGLRYEIPMSWITVKDYHDIHSIYVAGGYAWDTYGINSALVRRYVTAYGWETDEEPSEKSIPERAYKIADLDAYYGVLAARWLFNTEQVEDGDPGFGSYGFDIGVRYIRYQNCRVKHDNLAVASSHFNYYQVFINFFLKFRFLY